MVSESRLFKFQPGKMLDVNNICRICLREEDPKLPIFTDNDGKSESKLTLPEKIMSFAQVKVVKDDGLPTFICVKCYCQVDTTVEFKRLCEESFRFVMRQLDLHSKHTITSKNYEHKNSFENRKIISNGIDKPDLISKPPIYCNGIDELPSTKDLPNKQNESQEESLRIEENRMHEEEEQEEEREEEQTLQIYSTAGNVQTWNDDSDRVPCQIDVENTIIKSEPNWDYISDYEVDEVLENGYENYEEESLITTENHFDEEFKKPDESSDPLANNDSTTNSDKSWNCHSCEQTFSSRREMGFHISVTHRRCLTCGKYFFSNKHKDGHICGDFEAERKTYIKSIWKPKKDKKFSQLHKKGMKHIKPQLAPTKNRERRKKKPKPAETIQVNNHVSDDNKMEVEEKNKEPIFEPTKESDQKIQCHLCKQVCSTRRGFKTHMTTIHRDHKIVYTCQFCKNREFYSRIRCLKHMIKKHHRKDIDNLKFKFKPISQIEEMNNDKEDKNSKNEENKIIKKKRNVINKFECSYCAVKYLSFAECLDHLYTAHKISNAQKIIILRENVDESGEKNVKKMKFSGDCNEDVKKPAPVSDQKEKPMRKYRVNKLLRLSHPAFDTNGPAINSNFDITVDSLGIKIFTCRGCKLVFDRYVSAYNHYYTLNKRETILEQKQIEVKKFSCRLCSLKFASRSQAVSHRFQAHRLFYKQMKAAKKKLLEESLNES